MDRSPWSTCWSSPALAERTLTPTCAPGGGTTWRAGRMVQAPEVIDAPTGSDDDDDGDATDRPPVSHARRDPFDRVEYWSAGDRRRLFIFVFVQLGPKLLLRNTTITGGDTGAHVWFPDFLIDHFLPWRVAGGRTTSTPGSRPGSSTSRSRPSSSPSSTSSCRTNVAFKLVTAIGPIALPATRRVRPRHPGAASRGPDAGGRRHHVPVPQGRRRLHHDVRPAHHGRRPWPEHVPRASTRR